MGWAYDRGNETSLSPLVPKHTTAGARICIWIELAETFQENVEPPEERVTMKVDPKYPFIERLNDDNQRIGFGNSSTERTRIKADRNNFRSLKKRSLNINPILYASKVQLPLWNRSQKPSARSERHLAKPSASKTDVESALMSVRRIRTRKRTTNNSVMIS